MRSAVLAMSLALLSACGTIKSGSHHDEAFQSAFSQYKTFGWIADDPLVLGENQKSLISPLTKKKIVMAIEKTLGDMGYTKNTGDSDFVLAYTVGTRDKIDSQAYPVVYQGEWGWHLYGRYYYVNEPVHRMHTEGTLGVDIFDGRTNQPVWHGWASKTITAEDRSDPSDSIKQGVVEIFKHFPPPTGSNGSAD